MDLEQLPPNKPNFGLIVGLFAVSIIVLLLAALLVVHHMSRVEPHGAGHTSLQWTPPAQTAAIVRV
jgi:hypothetical protein